jgi:hypothetical protein
LLQYVGRVSPRDVCQYWPHTLYIQYHILCFSIFPQCINMECTYCTSVNQYFHRLNMELELQSSYGLHVTLCAQLFSLAEIPQPPPFPPHFGLINEGRHWSAKIDDISLQLPKYFHHFPETSY